AGCQAWVFLLLGVAGCRSVAVPYGTDPDAGEQHRNVVLARQLLTDCTVEFAKHPLKSCWDVTRESACHLTALAERIYDRGVAGCCAAGGEVPPLEPQPPEPTQLEGEMLKTMRRDAVPGITHIYPDGAEAWAALQHVIDQAKNRLDVMMFIW